MMPPGKYAQFQAERIAELEEECKSWEATAVERGHELLQLRAENERLKKEIMEMKRWEEMRGA